ncbi:MAG TPA: hypothetical protein VN881_04845 [Candidatus Acidoferrales bacterium]|nr:hypothetical protein [Candidatus Acidoferrales bacterium]
MTGNRRFYTWFAVCAFLIILAGFAHTYYLRFVFETKGLPLLLHVHGFLFTAWFVLFFVQVRLVARHRVDLHRKLGVVGAFLAPLCACVAIGVSFHAGRRFAQAHPNSLTNLRARPAAMDFGTSLMFLVLVGIALYLRRRPEFHKRIMVLACCSILLPAIGRIPLLFGNVFETVGFWGLVAITEVPPLACILYDTIKHRRLHPAFGWGGAVLLLSFPTFLLVGISDSWLKFLSWLVSR